jgi:flagellar biosynthesis protein
MREPTQKPNGNDAEVTEVAALSYDENAGGAPKVVAKGRGSIADKILELASDNDIPIHRDPTLISVLSALEVGAEIPPDLYGVIAEVLAWAYHTDRAAASMRGRRAA